MVLLLRIFRSALANTPTSIVPKHLRPILASPIHSVRYTLGWLHIIKLFPNYFLHPVIRGGGYGSEDRASRTLCDAVDEFLGSMSAFNIYMY